MNSAQLFTLALGLQSPWVIQTLEFKKVDGQKELHLAIDFETGTKFADDEDILCSVYDRKPKVWRHLNFFEHNVIFTAKCQE